MLKLFSSTFIANDTLNPHLSKDKWMIPMIEIFTVVFFTFFPLLFNLPYRDNLYLSWEGTYRLYLGQLPYKDFGMPIGYGYFLIPLLFFKIFGPFMRTLLYAQVLINLITIGFFRGIVKNIGLNPTERFLSILVFIVSYSFSFFWPWYNNTAFMFELGALYFILSIPVNRNWNYYLNIALSGLCTFLSFFSKQDYGGMTFILALILIGYNSFYFKDYRRVAYFIISIALFASAFIYPFVKFDFLYWFNYGQAPHQSRISLVHFLDEFFANSPWEKFYLVIMVLLFVDRFNGLKNFVNDRRNTLLFILCFGIVLQNLITKVTSRLPLESTTYFHGFAFAFIISHLNLSNYFKRKYSLVIASGLIFLWWSSVYWKYANRIIHLPGKTSTTISATTNPTTNTENEFVGEPWKPSPLKVYKGINLPASTNKGIERIKNLDVLKKGKNPKVLNMSELTPLAYEFNFLPQYHLPLWYHLNIGMFQKQVDDINTKIKGQEYDLVLFEVVPGLDNFYPFEVRDQLKRNYVQVDSFMAPRKLGDSHIEVFIKK